MTTQTGFGAALAAGIAMLLAATIAAGGSLAVASWAAAGNVTPPPMVGAVVDDGSPF